MTKVICMTNVKNLRYANNVTTRQKYKCDLFVFSNLQACFILFVHYCQLEVTSGSLQMQKYIGKKELTLIDLLKYRVPLEL